MARRASAQTLGFVARRPQAESVGLVFAARAASDQLAGLPELVVRGLPAAEAAALLDSALAGPLDPQVRDQIVAEAGGNPLALLELLRGVTPAELAGGFGLPGKVPMSRSIEALLTTWRGRQAPGELAFPHEPALPHSMT